MGLVLVLEMGDRLMDGTACRRRRNDGSRVKQVPGSKGVLEAVF